MTTQTEKFNDSQLKKVPDIRPGDIVKVHQKVKESLGKAHDKGEK